MWQMKPQRLLTTTILALSCFLANAESFVKKQYIDRFLNETYDSYILTINKTATYYLTNNRIVTDSHESECSQKTCFLRITDKDLFINGYSLLGDEEVTENIEIRIRLAQQIYIGTCKHSDDQKGCFVSFTKIAVGEFNKIFLNFSGDFALEVVQTFKVPKQADGKPVLNGLGRPLIMEPRKTVWFGTITK
jgi:hypothetical protein